MADETKHDDTDLRESKGGSGYTVNADGSVTYDDAEPSEETREAAQKEVEEAAAKRDAEAEEAAKKAGEEAREAQAQVASGQAGGEQEQASEDTTTTRETAEGGMAREKGTV